MASLSFEEPLTIVRTRGMLSIELNSYAADLVIAGAFGMGVVSTEAFTAGIASVPEPFSDADWGGWFVWRSFAHRYELITAASSLLATWSMEIDSKAMRKVQVNETLVVVAESQVGDFSVFDGTRHLLKLS